MSAGKAGCLLALLFGILSGCTSSLTPVNTMKNDSGNPGVSASPLDDVIPMNATGKIADQYIRSGVMYLRVGDYQNASRDFNTALRSEPQNSYLHFLNGLAYHLMAETGNSARYESAKIGYELALKCDRNNWLASQQLARLYLKNKEYTLAQEHFASTLLYRPNDSDLLYGLAQASYYARDLPTAFSAISQARKLKPESAEIVDAYAIISAATGQLDTAEKSLADFRQMMSSPIRAARLEERIGEWKDIYAVTENRTPTPASITNEPAPRQDAASIQADTLNNAVDEGRMVVIDVVMIRTEEYETSDKGVNVLDGVAKVDEAGSNFLNGLFVKFGGSIRTEKEEKTITSTITLPEIRYNLNIFNAADSRSEILARPTLIALDGQQSEFFGGGNLFVSVKGLQSGDLREIEAGVRLKVLPVFLSDDRIKLTVDAKRAFIEGGSVGTFQEGVSTSKNEVTATVVLKLGQTLVLSGMREKQTTEVKSGVPILRDIPLLQYIFSTERTLDLHRSILVLLTPRKVAAGLNISSDNSETEALDTAGRSDQPQLREFRRRYGYIFAQEGNIIHILRHLDKHAVMTGFRQTDLFDKPWWGSPESIDMILRRALSFLYY